MRKAANIKKLNRERLELLADVAEMYFIDGLNQSAIAKRVGVTRSMVSRMITEARQQGIVRIKIERPVAFDEGLSARLIKQFNLLDARVFCSRDEDYDHYLNRLGSVAADLFKPYIKPNMILGTAWGTAISAMVDALEYDHPVPAKVVQFVGALGTRNQDFEGHGVVQRLAQKLKCEGYFLNAPYIVDKPETVESLMENQSIKEAMELAKKSDVALLGIGTNDLNYSTYYNAGYLQLQEMQGLITQGAVGNVCSLFFDVKGNPAGLEFERRSFTISKPDLKKVPVRIGMAGGLGKIKPILGAIRGGYVNIIVTDDYTAREILKLNEKIEMEDTTQE